MSTEQPTIVVFPEGDRAKQLELQRDEYKRRFDAYSNNPRVRFQAPEARRSNSRNWYGMSILDALIRNGSVNMDTLAIELTAENHGLFNSQFYFAYFETIRQYVETGEAFGWPLPSLRD